MKFLYCFHSSHYVGNAENPWLVKLYHQEVAVVWFLYMTHEGPPAWRNFAVIPQFSFPKEVRHLLSLYLIAKGPDL